MSTFTHLLDKISFMPSESQAVAVVRPNVKLDMKKIGEAAWGISTFALFLLLGPFSAIAVVFGVASMAKQVDSPEPKSAC